MKNNKSKLLDILRDIISEQYNEEYYNEILDLYNKAGIEGMSEDEIQYLKSGGESKVPSRFGDDTDEMNDDEHFIVDWMMLDKLKKIVERIPRDFDFPYDEMEKPLNLYFVLKLKFSKKLFEYLYNHFGEKPIKGGKVSVRPVKLKDDMIYLTIPKSWFDELFGV
jgi:hypothetical protein